MSTPKRNVQWASETGQNILEAVVGLYENEPEVSSSAEGRKAIAQKYMDSNEVPEAYTSKKIAERIMKMGYDRSIPTGDPNLPPLKRRIKALIYEKWQRSALNSCAKSSGSGKSPADGISTAESQLGHLPPDCDSPDCDSPDPGPKKRKRKRTAADALDAYTAARFGKHTKQCNGDDRHLFKAHPVSAILFCETCGKIVSI